MATPDKIYTEKIDTFYGGIPDDVRIQGKEYCAMSQHLDVFTNPKRIVPFLSMEADEDLTFSIILFLYYTSILFGLGVVSGTSKVKVFYKNSDPISGAWTALGNGFDSAGARATTCFLEFHGYAYGGSAGTRIWAADLSGVAAFTQTAYSTAGEPVCQGIKTTDDKLIIPCASGIALKDGAGSGPTNVWSTYSIVPSSHKATDVCEFGDLAAIAAKPAVGTLGVNSKVFLWDKVNQDPAQVIDFGEGDLILLEEIEGQLVGVLQVGALSAVTQKARLVVRVWSGGTKAQQVKEVEADDNTLTIYGNHVKVKDGNRIVFGMKIKLDGTTYNQMFAIGRKTSAYPLAVTGDRLVDNDTALTGNIDGAFKIGSYYFIAHNQDGSVNRTNNDSSYASATPTYITPKINGESKVEDAARRRKVLKMAGLTTKALTSGQLASLYYRTDSTSTWTLIKTYTYGDDATAGTVPVNMGFEVGKQNNGDDFQNYKEMQFKAVPAGGAEITGIVWAWQLAGADVISG